MIRILLALGAGLAVFSTVFAAAALINIDTPNLGAGDETVATCDSDVGVEYTIDYDNVTDFRFEVTNVTVTGIDDVACDGQDVEVVLTDGGLNVGEGAGVVAGTSVLVAISPDPAAADVDDIHVSIHE